MFHIPASLLQKYTDSLVEPWDADNPQPTTRTEISITAHPDDFSKFVDWLYRGPEAVKTYQLLGYKGSLIWKIACDLQAEELKNQMVDYIQSLPFNDDFIFTLRIFAIWRLGDSAPVAYMCDKVVYEIVDKGWAHFIQAAGQGWDGLMSDPDSCAPLTKRIMEKFKDAYLAKDQGTLEDPMTREDCRWHEHTETTKLDCPRYQPEPQAKKVKREKD